MRVSGYRAMWIVAMFDLPVDTKEARRQYSRFRQALLADGFMKMQYSVYTRHCASRENAAVHIRRIERALPPDGEVRVIVITERQYEKMRIFLGRMRQPPEQIPNQLELF